MRTGIEADADALAIKISTMVRDHDPALVVFVLMKMLALTW